MNYLIDTYCDWEGKNFGFIVPLSSEQYEKILVLVERDTEGWLKIEPTHLTEDQVALINKYCDNSYMSRLQFGKLADGYLDQCLTDEDENPFYKGTGITK